MKEMNQLMVVHVSGGDGGVSAAIGAGAACLGAFGAGYAVGWLYAEVTGLPSAAGTVVGEAGNWIGIWGGSTHEPAISPKSDSSEVSEFQKIFGFPVEMYQ